VIVTMGRKSGSLTLGIGHAAGVTLSIIAEEFPAGPVALEQVCDVLEGSILKRRVAGRPDGVALVAEGVAERLTPEELQGLPGVHVSYDPHGHLRLHEVPLAKVLTHQIEQRFAARGEQMTMVDLDLGYELRCAHPVAFDRGYVRSLGWGAVHYLLSAEYAGGAIICLDFETDRTRPLLFADMLDEKGRTRVRMVDVDTQAYQVMREYMTRLERRDLEDPEMLRRLAEAAGTDPQTLRQRFERIH
jgi:6-phosphofructokinase 1